MYLKSIYKKFKSIYISKVHCSIAQISITEVFYNFNASVGYFQSLKCKTLIVE